MALQQYKDRKERLFKLGDFFDAVEQDYLKAFPDQKPIFKDGLRREIEKLYELREAIL